MKTTKTTTKPLFASARQLSELLDMDRDTLVRTAREAGIAPTKGGYPVKRMFTLLIGTDPGKMTPTMRGQLAKAQILEMRAQKEARQLIPVRECERAQAGIFETVARAYDEIPDILERDCGLPKDALVRVEKRLDAARVELHAALISYDAPPAESAS